MVIQQREDSDKNAWNIITRRSWNGWIRNDATSLTEGHGLFAPNRCCFHSPAFSLALWSTCTVRRPSFTDEDRMIYGTCLMCIDGNPFTPKHWKIKTDVTQIGRDVARLRISCGDVTRCSYNRSFSSPASQFPRTSTTLNTRTKILK